MKKLILIILGVAGILFGLLAFYLGARGANADYLCGEADKRQREVEKLRADYEAAKASHADTFRLGHEVADKWKEAKQWELMCADIRSSDRRALVIGILSGVVGATLFVFGLRLGRKKELPPSAAPAHP